MPTINSQTPTFPLSNASIRPAACHENDSRREMSVRQDGGLRAVHGGNAVLASDPGFGSRGGRFSVGDFLG